MTRLAQRAARALRPWLPAVAILAAVVAANLWAASSPRRFDLTSGQVYSMTPPTRAVLASIRQPVSITYFYDLRSKAHLDAKALLEEYAAANPNITLKTYDPMLQPAEARRHQVAFAGTGVFESAGRRVQVSGLDEPAFTNGLLRATKHAAQRICFTDGHTESDPLSLKSHDHMDGHEAPGHSHSAGGRALEIHERHGMGMARDALETLGYQVDKVLLLQGPGRLAGCSVVVVASPQQPFRPEEVQQLVQYVTAGGKLALLLEPFARSGLEPVLELFGIEYKPYPVSDDVQHYWVDPATPAVSAYPRHSVTRNLALTFFPGAGELTPRPGGLPDDVRVVPLVLTSASARIEAPSDPQGRLGGRRTRTLGLLATKQLAADRQPRAVVLADGDFATNSFFHILGNGQLFLNAVNFLAEQEDLIDIQPRNYELPKLRLTNGQMWFTFGISTVVLPAVLIAIGGGIWRRRRR